MKRLVRWTTLVLVAGMLILGGSYILRALRTLDEPLALNAPLRFVVPAGVSFAHVANQLAAQGVVRNARAWTLYARYEHLAQAVKAGEYEIQPGTTPRDLLAKMVSGQVLLHAFTIIDGWRVSDVLDALKRSPDIAATLPAGAPAVVAAALMERLGLPGLDPEGEFLPETYKFIGGTPEVEILRQAHVALQRELDAAWSGRDTSVPLHDPKELLIMASIIQKESGLPQELPKIAGLYLHRLAIGMRLQADPTVIYGLGEHYDGDIRSVDLRTDGALQYLYSRNGPAARRRSALPVRCRAMHATAHPEKTDAHLFRRLDARRRQHVSSPRRSNSTMPRWPRWLRTSEESGAGRLAVSAGRFITFEGIEGVGKSTQVARLAALRNERNVPHVVTREPGRHAAGGVDPRPGAPDPRRVRCRRVQSCC